MRDFAFTQSYIAGDEMQEFDLDHIFSYHAPANSTEIGKYESLREAAKTFVAAIIAATPPGADQSAAVRKVREAVMTANAAIALDGRLHK